MIYRKQGSTVRWENGTQIRITESGAAREDANFFECFPERRAGFSPPPIDGLKPVVRFAYERLILTEGHAQHQYTDKQWSEHTRRLHASLTQGALRALIDQATFDMTHIEQIAHALQRAEQNERDAPARLRVAPNVAAALIATVGEVKGARIVQTAGGVDGYGNDIVEAEGNWPNFYRPSYRVRPVRMPLNLRLECDSTEIDPDAPRAIALLAPADGPDLRMLIEDGRRVYPARVRVTRIAAASRDREWYPYGGGSFGAELML